MANRSCTGTEEVVPQYQFFTKRIEDSMANGMTTLQAIHELDTLRGSRTLPQLHHELQPKGRKKNLKGPDLLTASVPVDVLMDG